VVIRPKEELLLEGGGCAAGAGSAHAGGSDAVNPAALGSVERSVSAVFEEVALAKDIEPKEDVDGDAAISPGSQQPGRVEEQQQDEQMLARLQQGVPKLLESWVEQEQGEIVCMPTISYQVGLLEAGPQQKSGEVATTTSAGAAVGVRGVGAGAAVEGAGASVEDIRSGVREANAVAGGSRICLDGCYPACLTEGLCQEVLLVLGEEQAPMAEGAEVVDQRCSRSRFDLAVRVVVYEGSSGTALVDEEMDVSWEQGAGSMR
jgi:hypothetical protein